MLGLGGGLPADELFPRAAITDAFLKVIRAPSCPALQYGWPEGDAVLRSSNRPTFRSGCTTQWCAETPPFRHALLRGSSPLPRTTRPCSHAGKATSRATGSTSHERSSMRTARRDVSRAGGGDRIPRGTDSRAAGADSRRREGDHRPGEALRVAGESDHARGGTGCAGRERLRVRAKSIRPRAKSIRPRAKIGHARAKLVLTRGDRGKEGANGRRQEAQAIFRGKSSFVRAEET
jgi:hypothetical protein